MPIPATTFDYFDNNTQLPLKCERFQYMTESTSNSSLELKKIQNKTTLTVDGHLLDHKVFVGERGHDAFIVAGELDGWTNKVHSPVLAQRVVCGRFVTHADVLLHGSDGQRHLAGYPLVCRAGAVVEVPCDHQTFRLARAHSEQTVQHHELGAVKHGARHSLVDYHYAGLFRCKQIRVYLLLNTGRHIRKELV